MKALGDHGFPVPQAVDNNRHAVLMTMLDAHPLVQVKKLQHPAQVCSWANALQPEEICAQRAPACMPTLDHPSLLHACACLAPAAAAAVPRCT